MLRLKYLVLLLLFFLSIKTNAQDPNWNSMLTVPPNPSPYFSDWENNPQNITFSLQYLGQGSASVTLGFEITNTDNNIELLNGSSEVIEFTMPNERKDITGTELVNWDETTWNKGLKTKVERTGRFPEGNYEACITVYDMNNLGLTESCVEFSITYPDPPYLITPLTDEKIFSPLPTFQWSPVINNYSNEEIQYKIRIFELLKSQTPERAVTDNPAHFEEKTTMTAFSYPPSAQIIEMNKTYAWQIQALDMNDVPIAANDGKSEIWTFEYPDPNAILNGITFVNDGISDDEDYSSSTNELSANWSEVPGTKKYYYAIGTTEGGTDIVNWTDNGFLSNFIRTNLKLKEGTKYYVSVKAEGDYGTSNIKSSDGIIVKSSSPIELLTNVDTKIINYYYNNFSANDNGQLNSDSTYSRIFFTISGTEGKVIDIDINKVNINWKDKDNNVLMVQNNVPIEQFSNASIPYLLKSDDVGRFLNFIPTHLPNSFIENKINQWIIEYDKLTEDYITKIKNDPSIKAEDIPSLVQNWNDSLKQTYLMELVFEGSYLENNVKRKITTDPIELTLNYHNNAKDINLVDVTCSNTNLVFSPLKTKNELDISFYKYSSIDASNIIIDRRKEFWYKNGILSKTNMQKFSSPIILKDSKETHIKLPIVANKQMQADLFDKNNKTEYKLDIEFSGKDKDYNDVTYKLKDKISVLFALNTRLASTVSPKNLNYSPSHLSNKCEFTLAYQAPAGNWIQIDSLTANWWNETDNKFYKSTTQAFPIKINSSQPITQPLRVKFDASSFKTALDNKDTAKYKADFTFWGKDQNGNKVSYADNRSDINVTFCSTDKKIRLASTVSPKNLNYSPSHLSNKCEFTLTYQAPAGNSIQIDSLTANWWNETDSKFYKSTTQAFPIKINSSQPITQPLRVKFDASSFKTALDNKDTAKYKVDFTFWGKDQNGNKVSYADNRSDINVTFSSTDQNQKAVKGTNYEIIPGKVFVQPIAQTIINNNGKKISMDGQVKLILTSDPFKKDSAFVEVENLTFTKNKKLFKVSGGTFSGKTIGHEDDVFHFKTSGLKIQVKEISYTYSKAKNKIFLNKAFTKLPVIGKKLYFSNLIVDKNGLDFSVSKQEFKVFGLVFIAKEIKKQKFPSGNSKFSLGVGIRLNNKANKPEKEEFFSGKLVFQKIQNGETTIKLEGATGGSNALVHLIPTTDYLNFNSLEFIQKPTKNKDWALRVGVSSTGLPIYSKIIKEPLKTFFEFEKSGKISGKVVLIDEPKHGYNTDDKTVLKIGKLAALDLTYLGYQIEQVKKITTVDAKPDTSWEFDFSKSKIAISGDLYLASKDKKLSDSTNRIAFGEINNPGITIGFDGNIKTQTISVAKNKKLDLGPLFLEMTTFALKPYPFEIAISGDIGVDMKAVSGGFKVANLKINGEGEFTNFSDPSVVTEGNLSILKTVGLSIGGISYSNTPTTLNLPNGKNTQSSNLKVDSYFRLKGAKLDIAGGAAGGKFKELLVYKPTDTGAKTNFILDDGEVKIGKTASLKIDMQYVDDGQGNSFIGVGGSATVLEKYGATLYGKIGQRKNTNNPKDNAYWGFFIALKLGQGIPIGPVNLTGVGGGFFYRPLAEDIKTVTNLAGFTPLKISGVDPSGKPKPALEQKWALFLYAGLNVVDKNFIAGQALITVTDSYFKLNANVTAIKKVTGKAYLNINWKQEYVEGKFNFGLHFVVLEAKESKNYLQFYAYKKSNWGIMGKTDMTVMLISKVTSDIYIGNKGFLFDFEVTYSVDLGVVSGGMRYGAMAWWKKGVSWGLYAHGNVWGEVLWGLVGADFGVEGALIGAEPDYFIYVSGYLKVKVLFVNAFSGTVWISLGTDGLDGGTGRNKKFDDLIADARNTGKQMKKEMNDMQKKLADARKALFQLSEAQRKAAGKALLQLSVWAEKDGWDYFDAFMFKVKFEKDLYLDTLDMAYSSTSWVNNSVTPDPYYKKAFDLIWNTKAKKLDDIKNKLKQDSVEIANALDDIDAMEGQLSKLLTDHKELLEEELPTISELGKLSSPASKPILTPSTITIDSKTKQVIKFEYSLDTNEVKSQKNKVAAQKKETNAYHKQLVAMVGEYITKLKKMREIISGNKNSIKAITNKYAATFDKVSNYTTGFMDYLNANQSWANNQASELGKLKKYIDIFGNTNQSKNDIFRGVVLDNTVPGFTKICSRRIYLIKELIRLGVAKAKDFDPPKEDITWKNFFDMGKELYYYIPYKGYSSVADEMSEARQTLVKDFKYNNDIYQANWNSFTMKSDKVYSRQVKLYTILYDLLDQLSLETGTRKVERSSDNLIVSTGNSGYNDIHNQIPIVNVTGTVGTSGSSSSNNYRFGSISTVGSSAAGSGSFTQAIQSGAINSAIGNNYSSKKFSTKNQANIKGRVHKKGSWAEEMDFEKARLTVKKILQVPKIVQLTGKAISDQNTMGYAKLTLNWKGTHPIDIAEYSFSIDGYSDVVKAGSGSSGNSLSGNSEGNVVGVAISPIDPVGFYWGNEGNASGNNDVDLTDANQDDKYGPGDYEYSDPNAVPPKAWRTLGNKESIVFPFLDGVHKIGNYDIWLRARGAGGYTLERMSSIYIDYYGAASKTSDFDFSKKESSLKTTDNTPPTTPSVIDNGDTTSSTRQIFAKWSATDYESGIQEYKYRVVYENNAGRTPAVIPWTSAGGQTEMNIRFEEKMKPGRTYYVEVKAVNGVGKWSSIGSSDGIKLSDQTPPTTPSFTERRRSNNTFSKKIILNDSLLIGGWNSAFDPETGVMGYLFAIGTTKGASDIINWCATTTTELNMNKHELSKILNVKLQKNTTYYFSVKAINGIGIVGAAAQLPIVVQ